MAVLFDQQERQCVARLVAMRSPVSLYTPTVKKLPQNTKLVKSYVRKQMKKIGFALSMDDAQMRITAREKSFLDNLRNESFHEPIHARRRIRES